MSNKKSWFEVSTDGLKSLQAGKPKVYVPRELIQNAWDEKITKCEVEITYREPLSLIRVVDDSPKGYKYIEDSYTLFRHSEKRGDPNKRGRFNLGEKQALCVCEEGKIITTKGVVTFNKDGRHFSKKGIEKGSIIEMKIELTREEYEDMVEIISSYLPPKGIVYSVNGKAISHKKPFQKFKAQLATEIESNGIFKGTRRITEVHVHKADKTYLYEMGIPVMEIDCDYSIDVQQKIPLSVDRESVKQGYLKDIYAEVLNHTFEDLDKDHVSETWVRTGMSDDRISDDAVKNVVNKRFGEKVCIANPNDPYSKDKALTKGYNLVYGREMSKSEWDNIKRAGAMKSSTSLFKPNFTSEGKYISPNKNQRRVRDYYKKLAKKLLGFDIQIEFWDAPVDILADYGSRKFRMFVNKLPRNFFNSISVEVDSLWIHEVAHEYGHHTDSSYIDACTSLGAKMKRLALKNPEFFNID